VASWRPICSGVSSSKNAGDEACVVDEHVDRAETVDARVLLAGDVERDDQRALRVAERVVDVR
jgi:hypothetical protein